MPPIYNVKLMIIAKTCGYLLLQSFTDHYSKTMGATSVIEIAYTFGATAFLLFIGFLTPTCKY
jgi:hypothetical protein